VGRGPTISRSLSHRKFRPPQIVDATQSAPKIVWLGHDFFVLWDRLLARISHQHGMVFCCQASV
jgi:hypothetical protein